MIRSDTPGLSYKNDGTPWWKPPARYAKQACPVKARRLIGTRSDGMDEARATECRLLQREADDWWNGLDLPTSLPGTWAYLIDRYLTDEYSPAQEVKANTRYVYGRDAAYWRSRIGKLRIASMDYVVLKKMMSSMRANGHNASFVHHKFTMLRQLTSYGAVLKMAGAKDVRETLAEMRISRGAPRTMAPTRAQFEIAVAEADRRGWHAFACGLTVQYEFSLRAVDVRGQYMRGGDGGLSYGGTKRWLDGLTWDMFDADLTHFRKVISKTAKSMPEPYTFDLTPLPALRARLRMLRGDQRFGPCFLNSDGKPFGQPTWSTKWRQVREATGLPDSMWSMDMRAGGVTEAQDKGATPMQLRDAAQHANISMTDRYARGRSENANNVVKLRRSD